MRGLALVCLLVTGCDRLFGISAFADASVHGDVGDLMDGSAQCSTTLGTGPLRDLCAPGAVGPVQLSGRFDTTQCQGGMLVTAGASLCVVFGTTIQVGTLRAVGTRPLVLAATDTVSIVGELDAGSSATEVGPGGTVGCTMPGAAGSDGVVSGGGGGGGAGGAFQGKGGDGVAGSTSMGGLAGAGAQGTALGIRGGCPGAPGGNKYMTTNTAGAAGDGGGVIYLIARTSISIAGTIRAGGGGGAPGGAQGGGGGAGSGGLIALDAPALVLTSTPRLCANGGGGGGGGTIAAAGQHGMNGCGSNLPAAGGPGSGTGGAGSSGSTRDGGNAVPDASDGGGGGGGAAGYIQVYGGASAVQLAANADVSPLPTN